MCQLKKIERRIMPTDFVRKFLEEACKELENENSYKRRMLLYPINDWKRFCKAGRDLFYLNYCKKSVVPQKDVNQFQRVKTLGVGTYGKVILVRLKGADQFFAMKVLEKEKLVLNNIVHNALNEKRVLQSLRFPFCIYLEYFSMDYANLYFIMPFVQGGELYLWIHKTNNGLSETTARFFGAQVILALEYLHGCSLIYRDLKPENILVDNTGYLKIADFGFCKCLHGSNRTYTLCGTPEYIAPEVIINKGYGFSADWWALGVLLFEMVTASPPFYYQNGNHMAIYERILAGKYTEPVNATSDFRVLLRGLLEVDITKRYGCLINQSEDIKMCHFFDRVNWLDLVNKKVQAPFLPPVADLGDTSNFPHFSERPLDFLPFDKYDQEFRDF